MATALLFSYYADGIEGYVTPTILLSSHPVDATRIECLLKAEGYIVPQASHIAVTSKHVGVRNCRRYGRLILRSAIK